MKGMLCQVYRQNSLGDCTNSGISSRNDKFVLTGDVIEGIFEVDGHISELRYCVECLGAYGTRIAAYPVNSEGEVVRGMFGGNFIYTSDSRFPEDAPIKIFDRFE